MLAVVAALVLVVPVLFGDDDVAPSPTPPARTQQTMVMMLAGEYSSSFASALMAADPAADDGSVVLVPSSLLVDGPSPEAIRFGSTVRYPDPNAPAVALEDTLAVVIDATWRLSPMGLAQLVDAVGGVSVSVEDDVILTRRDGTREVVVPGGTTQLSGTQAAAYSAVLPTGEEEASRLAHFNAVLFALIPELPSDQAELESLLKGLGRESAVTTGVPWLASFLLAEQSAMDAGNVTATTLPVDSIDVGSPQAVYAVDQEAAETLMAASFAGSRPPGGADRLSVLAQNGVGRPGLVESAGEKLRDAGYAFVNGGNANRFGYAKTVIVVPDTTDESLANGRAIADVLGVPASAVQVAAEGQSVADVVVIIGADYEA